MKKRLKYANRRPISVDNEKPTLDLKMYEVEYCEGYVAEMAANVIAQNLFTQVDQDGNIFVLIESIINTRTDVTQTLQQYAFVITKRSTKTKKKYK